MSAYDIYIRDLQSKTQNMTAFNTLTFFTGDVNINNGIVSGSTGSFTSLSANTCSIDTLTLNDSFSGPTGSFVSLSANTLYSGTGSFDYLTASNIYGPTGSFVSLSANTVVCDNITLEGDDLETILATMEGEIDTLQSQTQNLTANTSTSTFAQNLLVSGNTTVQKLTAGNTAVSALTSTLGIRSQTGSGGATQNNYVNFEWNNPSFSIFVDTTRVFRNVVREQYTLDPPTKYKDITVPYAGTSTIWQIDIDWYNTGTAFGGTVSPAPSINIQFGSSANTPITTGYNAHYHVFSGGTVSTTTATTSFVLAATSTQALGYWFGRTTISYVSQTVLQFQNIWYDRSDRTWMSSGYFNGDGNPLYYIRLNVADGAGAGTFSSGTTAILTYRYN